MVDPDLRDNMLRKKYKIRWAELSSTVLHEYTVKSKCNELLRTVFLNHDLLLCDCSNCTNVVHLKAIALMYRPIIDFLLQAG